MIKKLFFFFSVYASAAFAQQPDNIGFESGTTTNWICGSGTYGKKTVDSCIRPLTFKIDYLGKCLDEDGINATNTPSIPATNRHTLMSSGTDPNAFDSVPCVAPADLFPDKVNSYSFRLGNSVTNLQPKGPDSLAFTEGIKFKLLVNASNVQLTYLFALFANDAYHTEAESGRFIVKISDPQENIINYFHMAPGDHFGLLPGKKEQNSQWMYTKWKKVKVDLSAYIGQTISIEFSTADCYPSTPDLFDRHKCRSTAGGHAVYAYIDLYCESITTDIPFSDKNNISVNIYPNPFTTESTIEVTGLSNIHSTDLKMYNYLGQEVKSISLKNGSQQLSRGHLPAGIYFLEIVQQGKIMARKKMVIND